MKDNLFITSANGKLYQYYDGELTTVFEPEEKEMLTGLTKHEDTLYMTGDGTVYRIAFDDKNFTLEVQDIIKIPKINPLLGQAKIIGDRLFITSVAINGFYMFNLELTRVRTCEIPYVREVGWCMGEGTHRETGERFLSKLALEREATLHGNNIHVNSIFHYNDILYVNCSMFKEDGRSGCVILNLALDEIDRFENGWRAYSFCIIEGRKYCLCNSWSEQEDSFDVPDRGGIFLDCMLIEPWEDGWFCKDMSISSDKIFVVGGRSKKNINERKNTDSIVLTLDRKNLNLLRRDIFYGVGEFRGCLLLEDDLTDA